MGGYSNSDGCFRVIESLVKDIDIHGVNLFGGQDGVHRLMHGISGNLYEFMHILSGMTYPI